MRNRLQTPSPAGPVNPVPSFEDTGMLAPALGLSFLLRMCQDFSPLKVSHLLFSLPRTPFPGASHFVVLHSDFTSAGLL